jgi:hypothetical protein
MLACGEPFGWLTAYWLIAAQQSLAPLIEARRNHSLNNYYQQIKRASRPAKQAID